MAKTSSEAGRKVLCGPAERRLEFGNGVTLPDPCPLLTAREAALLYRLVLPLPDPWKEDPGPPRLLPGGEVLFRV